MFVVELDRYLVDVALVIARFVISVEKLGFVVFGRFVEEVGFVAFRSDVEVELGIVVVVIAIVEFVVVVEVKVVN
jgi:hypothetical protein